MKNVNIGKNNQTDRIAEYLMINKNVGSGDGIEIQKYSDLVKEIAKLSFLNQDYMLFYRGQSFDFQNSTNSSSSLYPSIYRDRINKKDNDIKLRVSTLNKAAELLVEEIKKSEYIGKTEIIKKKYVQWSILQHYEICDTPLLDLTHSLRVACSFAFENNSSDKGYLYVLGMPYVTHRISTNSEQETIIVRLLSISPPQALRPYYQDGYLVGTEFVTEDFDDKQELDLARRLIAKYRIKNTDEFWDQDTKKIPYELLYPSDDFDFLDLARKIKERLNVVEYNHEFAEEYGKFMLKWIEIERYSNNRNIYSIFKKYYNSEIIDRYLFDKIQELRMFRNNLVHKPSVITINDLRKYNMYIQEVIQELETKL